MRGRGRGIRVSGRYSSGKCEGTETRKMGDGPDKDEELKFRPRQQWNTSRTTEGEWTHHTPGEPGGYIGGILERSLSKRVPVLGKRDVPRLKKITP